LKYQKKQKCSSPDLIKLLEDGGCPWEFCGGKLYCEPTMTDSNSYSSKNGWEIRCHNGHLIPVICKNGIFCIDEEYLKIVMEERGIKIVIKKG